MNGTAGEDWPLAGEGPFCLSWDLEGMVQMAVVGLQVFRWWEEENVHVFRASLSFFKIKVKSLAENIGG